MSAGSLFRFDVSPLSLVLRVGVIYLGILVLLRFSGKRQMGQMGPTEFVSLLLISNAVQNAMNGGDNSLVGGLLLAFALIVMSKLISLFTYRHRFFRAVFEGTPTLLVHKGKVIPSHLRKEYLSESDLRVLLRKQGIHTLQEVYSAVLEADGTFSVTREGD